MRERGEQAWQGKLVYGATTTRGLWGPSWVAPAVVLKRCKMSLFCSPTVVCPQLPAVLHTNQSGTAELKATLQFPDKDSAKATCSLEARGTGVWVQMGDLVSASWHSPQRQQEAI